MFKVCIDRVGTVYTVHYVRGQIAAAKLAALLWHINTQLQFTRAYQQCGLLVSVEIQPE